MRKVRTIFRTNDARAKLLETRFSARAQRSERLAHAQLHVVDVGEEGEQLERRRKGGQQHRLAARGRVARDAHVRPEAVLDTKHVQQVCQRLAWREGDQAAGRRRLPTAAARRQLDDGHVAQRGGELVDGEVGVPLRLVALWSDDGGARLLGGDQRVGARKGNLWRPYRHVTTATTAFQCRVVGARERWPLRSPSATS